MSQLTEAQWREEWRAGLLKSIRCLATVSERRPSLFGDEWEILFHAEVGLEIQASRKLLLLGGMAGEW